MEDWSDQQRRIIVTEGCGAHAPPPTDGRSGNHIKVGSLRARTARGGLKTSAASPFSLGRAGMFSATSRLPLGQPSGAFGADRSVPVVGVVVQLSPKGFSKWQWWPGPIHSTAPVVGNASANSRNIVSQLATTRRRRIRRMQLV